MFADWLLKLAGEDPAAYSTQADKWIYVYALYSNEIIFGISFALTSLFWFLVLKKYFLQKSILVKILVFIFVLVVFNIVLHFADVILTGYGSGGGI